MVGIAPKISKKLKDIGEQSWPEYASKLRKDPIKPPCQEKLESFITDREQAGEASCDLTQSLQPASNQQTQPVNNATNDEERVGDEDEEFGDEGEEFGDEDEEFGDDDEEFGEDTTPPQAKTKSLRIPMPKSSVTTTKSSVMTTKSSVMTTTSSVMTTKSSVMTTTSSVTTKSSVTILRFNTPTTQSNKKEEVQKNQNIDVHSNPVLQTELPVRITNSRYLIKVNARLETVSEL